MHKKEHLRTAFVVTSVIVAALTMTALQTLAGGGDGAAGTGSTRQGWKGDNGTMSPASVPHQLVVKLRTDTVQFNAGHSIVREYADHLNQGPVYLINLDPSADVLQAAAAISASPDVEYAHPNFVMNRSYPIQGSYPFSDQNFKGDYANQYASSQLHLDEAHQLAAGAGAVVGVIDGGIDVSFPALGGSALSGYDFVDGDNDAFDEPGGQTSGHGTFVAGVIHLIAPSATIRSYRVIDTAGDGDGFTLAKAIELAVADGCTIINISLALTERHLAVRDAIDQANARGVLVVSGAGNLSTSTKVYPAAEDNVLAVAALDSLSRKTDFSNWGSYVDLCAPGANVYSTFRKPYFAWWSGTSFSAPFVSGLAALLKQQFPTAQGLQIQNRLILTAKKVDAYNPAFMGLLGAGIVDPVAALTAVVTEETALFIPDTLYCTYSQFTRFLVVPMVQGMLLSTNAPAPYIPNIIDTGTFAFTWVDDTSGATNDTVDIYIRTTDNVGTYYNTIAFNVIGVARPALVTVKMTVVPFDQLRQIAWLNPPEMWFTGTVNSEIYSATGGASYLSSSNAPAAFHAELHPGDGNFVSLITATGQTNDSVRFGVDVDAAIRPGFYTDSIFYYVEGITNPAVLLIHLTALDTVTQNEWYVYPEFSWYTAPAGTNTTQHSGVVVGSYGSGAIPFSASLLDAADFTQLTTTSGTTLDSIRFDIVSTSGMLPGIYRDTLIIQSTGDAYINPLMAVLTLKVDTSSGGYDSVYVSPTSQVFTAPGGIPSQSTGSFVVGSSGPSISFVIEARGTWLFTHLTNLTGMTNSTVVFDIVPTNTAPGIYTDTLVVYFDAIRRSPIMVLNALYIDTDTASQGDRAWVIPSAIGFVVPNSSSAIVYQQVLLRSTTGADYSASDFPNGENWLVYDLTGRSNDSVTIGVNPTGLTAGIYKDTLAFAVAGISQPALLPVVLTVTGSDSGPSASGANLALSNYPNPFNPSTEVVYTLPVSSHVTLKIYDVMGREVYTLVDEAKIAGTHRLMWSGFTSDGNQASSGVYLYRVEANGVSLTRKMLLLK